MSDSARRPTVEEIEQLKEQVRRDPGSPAFVELGEAYLALGRSNEAIDTGTRGLHTSPDSTAGRMMLGRAYVMVHQWKYAQTELLKLVKADRNHAAGFALLGEVLLRRQDMDRALPVLQHAQNLNPTNPHVEDLLKRARTGDPLPPPPAIPVPQDPRPASVGGFPPRAASNDPLQFGSDDPTRVSPGLTPTGMPTLNARPLTDVPTPAPAKMPAEGGAKTIMVAAAPAGISKPPSPVPVPAPAPVKAKAKPAPAKADSGDKKKKSVAPEDMPPAGRPPGVVPRIVSMNKPTEAAKQALREAADVGDYLNTLLTEGLLNVPSIATDGSKFSARRAKRWGRSTVRTFVFLFALLASSLGGGAYWVYRAETQRQEDVVRNIANARTLIEIGRSEDLVLALERAAEALERDPNHLPAMAVFARVASLNSLAYGTPTNKADAAMLRARAGISEGEEGWPDILFAESALTLVTLDDDSRGAPRDRLQDTRGKLDAWLEANPDDHWMHWLQGIAMLAVSDVSGASKAFDAAEAGGEGPTLAVIYRADLQVDQGDLDGASQRYKTVLERAKDHPLALLGQAFISIDRAEEPADIVGVLNNRFGESPTPRVSKYQNLGLALIYQALEDPDLYVKHLEAAQGNTEPRFLARVALSQLAGGQLTAAGDTRDRIVWYTDKPTEPYPLVAVVDAELQWVFGLPAQALELVGDLQHVSARHVRGRSLYELGRTEDARAEFAGILEFAAEDWIAQTWHNAAVMVTSPGRARREANEAFKPLLRYHKSKMVRYVHGTGFRKLSNNRDARVKFQESLQDISVERPNPIAYRSHVALAELDIEREQTESALKHLKEALELNPGYVPAASVLGQLQVQSGDHAAAIKTLGPILEEPDAASADIELAYAEALVSRRRVSKAERAEAREALARARTKGGSRGRGRSVPCARCPA